MKKYIPAYAVAAALAIGMPVAKAAIPLGDYVTFSGFGTVGAVETSSDQGLFGRDLQSGGANKNPSFNVDSNLGLQLNATATSWLSGTFQVLAEDRNRDYIQPNVQLAYVAAKPIDNVTVRVGRVNAPLFAVSESLFIGYANTWLRAPNEVYALAVFSTVNGVDATYRLDMGSTALSLSAITGKSSAVLAGQPERIHNLEGLNLQLETEWATYRYGYTKARFDVPGVFVFNDRYSFSGLGVSVDHNNIIAQSEFVKRTSEGSPTIIDSDGWYVMGGYRFGSLAPYAIFSKTFRATPNPIPVTVGPQKTTALGLRWDAFTSADIKFQIERVDTFDTVGISFTTRAVPDPFGPPLLAPVANPVTAFSVAVDFTF